MLICGKLLEKKGPDKNLEKQVQQILFRTLPQQSVSFSKLHHHWSDILYIKKSLGILKLVILLYNWQFCSFEKIVMEIYNTVNRCP